jgi:Tfp pilus assembly protein PilF
MSRKRRAKQQTSQSASASRALPPDTSRGLGFNTPTLTALSLLLAILTAIIYSPIAKHPFINFDDGAYITSNTHIQSGLTAETIRWAVTSFYAANWHPLTWLVHATNVDFFGLDAGGHHATSMALHVFNVVLLFLLLSRATYSVASSAVVAALFAVHPLNVESVAWAAELKNVLCTFFFFLAVGAYGWYSQKPSVLRYLSVALLFVLGLASKPMVLTLPFVLFLLDFWPLNRIRERVEPNPSFMVPQQSLLFLVLEKLPLLALSCASAVITIYGQKSSGATTMIRVSLPSRIANALFSYAAYIGKAFVPVGLAPFYPYPLGGLPLWQPGVGALLLLAVSAIVLWKCREHRYLATGWFWYLGTLVPVIGLLQVGGQARADRYCYIPLIGILVMVVWGLSDLANARKAGNKVPLVAAAAVIAAFAILTSRQISHWSSSYELWTHALSVTENNAVAEHNLGTVLIRLGRIDEVYPHLRRAIELDPSDNVSRLNLGNTYSSQGRHQEALREYEAVLQQSTDTKLLFPAFLNAGTSNRKLHQYAEAEAAFRQALRIVPNDPTALKGLELIARETKLPPSASPQ